MPQKRNRIKKVSGNPAKVKIRSRRFVHSTNYKNKIFLFNRKPSFILMFPLIVILKTEINSYFNILYAV